MAEGDNAGRTGRGHTGMQSGQLAVSSAKRLVAGGVLVAVSLVGVGAWLAGRHQAKPAPPAAVSPRDAAKAPVSSHPSPVSPQAPAASAEAALKAGGKALGKGDLRAAETSYREARRAALKAPTPKARKQAAEAAYGLAYVKAFRKDFRGARSLFAAARREAWDGGRGTGDESGGDPAASHVPRPPSPSPLNERAAYQEAVCIAAEQGKDAGIAAFEGFVERYPYSTLIHAAVQRGRRLNGREPTARLEKLWRRAQALQRERERKERTAASMCGPQCLAAVLEGFGIHATIAELAREAGTNEEGTSLDGLAQAARKRGLSAVGLKVTPEALRKETLPAIALAGRHYVVIERVGRSGVTVRDQRPETRDQRPGGGDQRSAGNIEYRTPNDEYRRAGGPGGDQGPAATDHRPQTREIPWKEWEREWGGVILRVQLRAARA